MSLRDTWGRGRWHFAFVGALACASAVACQGKVIAFSSRQCATNADCQTAHGANWMCRASDGQCQNAVTADCPGEKILGAENLGDPDAVVYGAIFALSGENSAIGNGEYEALKLAYEDVGMVASGGALPPPSASLPPLPGSTKRRPLAVVVCDDASTDDVSLRAVQHLTHDLGIQAIVGATWDGAAIDFLGDHGGTVAAGALVIGSGTTSPDLTTHGKGSPSLFYRTCESTAVEGLAIATLAEGLEAKLLQALSLQRTKEALIYKGDSYGKGTAVVVARNLVINGIAAQDPNNVPYFLFKDYGDPSDPVTDPLKYTETVSAVLAHQPNIILAMGTSEMFGQIMVPVEQQWPAGVKKPFWIFPHMGVSKALLAAMQMVDPNNLDIHKRVMGVTYGPNPHNPNSPGSSNFQQFLGEFTASVTDGTSAYTVDANTTYDAFFTLAYLTVANGAQPITGANLSSQMAKLTTGQTTVNVGTTDLSNGLTLLSQGASVKIVGTSGPLDFDLKTGDVHQENQVWCVPLQQGHLVPPPFSGYGFDLNYKPFGTIDTLTPACGIDFLP